MGLGDDIMALGHSKYMLKENKNTKIILAGKSYDSPIYKHHPRLIYPIQHDPASKQYGANFEIQGQLERSEEYDRVIKKMYPKFYQDIKPFNWNKQKNTGLFYLAYMRDGISYKDWTKKHRRLVTHQYSPIPADIYFRQHEIDKAKRTLKSLNIAKFIFINITVKSQLQLNKYWGKDNYIKLVKLIKDYDNSISIVTCLPSKHKFYGETNIPGITVIKTDAMREAMSILTQASLMVTGEGGMHHAAGALNIPGIVLFGHFISPASTGYKVHTNYFYDDKTEDNKFGCGKWARECPKCTHAMNNLFTPDVVFKEIQKILKDKQPNRRLFINPDGKYGYMSKI